jgi:hypothetical protein
MDERGYNKLDDFIEKHSETSSWEELNRDF